MKLIKKELPKPLPQTKYTIEVTGAELLQLYKAMGKMDFGYSLYSELGDIAKEEGLK